MKQLTTQRVGVVVIASGREAHLQRLLDGLALQTRPADHIVVVGMGPKDESAAKVRSPAQTVRLPTLGDQLPLGAARNLGAAMLSNVSNLSHVSNLSIDTAVFLDVDCIPHPDLVADYLDGLGAHPDALACGCVRYLSEAWAQRPQTGVDALEASSEHHPARPRPVRGTVDRQHYELFWSLNFAVRLNVWHDLGGFNEAYVGYGAEDTDLGLRAREKSIPLLWLPAARAYHQWHPPTRLDPRQLQGMVRNAHTFHRRWGVWPMHGWLRELHTAGALRFDPEADVLEVLT